MRAGSAGSAGAAVRCAHATDSSLKTRPNLQPKTTFDVAQTHGQQWLCALQRLDLALLIDAQHQRMIGRIQVQTRDVAHLLEEGRVVGQLEAARAVRGDARRAEQAMRHVLADVGFGCEAAHALQCVGLAGRVCSACFNRSATR